jgi:hypothetical protein
MLVALEDVLTVRGDMLPFWDVSSSITMTPAAAVGEVGATYSCISSRSRRCNWNSNTTKSITV